MIHGLPTSFFGSIVSLATIIRHGIYTTSSLLQSLLNSCSIFSIIGYHCLSWHVHNFISDGICIVGHGSYMTLLAMHSTAHHRPLIQGIQGFNDQTSTKYCQCNFNTTILTTNNTQHHWTTQQPRILHDIIRCGSYLALLAVAFTSM